MIVFLITCGVCLGIAAIGFIIFYFVRNYNSIINRAKKIDPTVKTMSEAKLILQKDIAKNVSKESKETNKKFCKNCGESIDEDSKFCKKCGKEQ